MARIIGLLLFLTGMGALLGATWMHQASPSNSTSTLHTMDNGVPIPPPGQ